MNLVKTIEPKKGLVRYSESITTKKYSDDTKKDILSITNIKNEVIFKDKDREYPDGKIIVSEERVESYDYNYTKDNDGNIVNCSISKTVKKNGKMIDFEKVSSEKHYDNEGRLILENFFTRDGIKYNSVRYSYNEDNDVVETIAKGTHNIRTTKYYKGEVSEITDKTIKTKAVYTAYKAFFDNNGRVYKVYDNDKHIRIDYERDFDSEGNVLSVTKRFFDTSNPIYPKLISYVVTSYVPAAGYKIGKIVKNGILTEDHTYDLNGEEIEMRINEENKEVFIRKESTVDPDTGNVTVITTETTICTKTGGTKIKMIKKVYDKDNKLLVYSEDNSIVSTYEYDDEGRRSLVITKKLVDDEFIVINEITYNYFNDEETSNSKRTKETKVYDEAGNVKLIHTDEEEYNPTEEKYFTSNEIFELD